MTNRTMTVREKAQRIARSLRKEEPDYYYLKELFRHLRNELNIKVTRQSKHLPYVPTESEITNYYDIVFKSNNTSSTFTEKYFTLSTEPNTVSTPIESYTIVNRKT